MKIGDFLDDRRLEPTAVSGTAGGAIEALENPLALCVRNRRPFIIHCDGAATASRLLSR